MNDITPGTVDRPFAFGTFGFAGWAAVSACRIASSCAWVMVPLTTRPSRTALILSFGWSLSASATVGSPTVAASALTKGWNPARPAQPTNAVVNAPAATAIAHLLRDISTLLNARLLFYQSNAAGGFCCVPKGQFARFLRTADNLPDAIPHDALRPRLGVAAPGRVRRRRGRALREGRRARGRGRIVAAGARSPRLRGHAVRAPSRDDRSREVGHPA